MRCGRISGLDVTLSSPVLQVSTPVTAFYIYFSPCEQYMRGQDVWVYHNAYLAVAGLEVQLYKDPILISFTPV